MSTALATSPTHEPSKLTKKTKGHYVLLLKTERVALKCFLSPGLESRFTCSGDVSDVVSFLRQRAEMIVEKNPWLCAWLKAHPIARTTCLFVPDEPDVNRFFCEIPVEGINLEDGLKHTVVKTAEQVINTDGPIVRFSVVYSKDPTVKDYLVTVCCNHSVGEPNLMYKVWGMFSEGADIEELIVKRNHAYKSNPLCALKGKARKKFMYYAFRSDGSPIKSMLKGHEYKGDTSPIMHRRYVNTDWIQEQKLAYAKRRAESNDETLPTYLSTQDLLTAWFFPQFRPSCIAVAYDMRDRVKNCTKLHMGNYLEGLVLYPKEYLDPSLIRRAVASEGVWAPKNNKPKFPELEESEGPSTNTTTSNEGNGSKQKKKKKKKKDNSCGFVTGWHGRYVELKIPHSERKTHLPLRGAMFTGVIPRVLPALCIFRTSEKKYAILTLSTSELTDTSAFGPEVEV